MRLEAEAREDSAGRFFSGSFTIALQAVWRDFAAFGSLIALLIVSKSALAIEAILYGRFSDVTKYY